MLINDDETVSLTKEEFSKYFFSKTKPESKLGYEVSWVNGRELCNLFPMLSYGKVKDRKWRNENDFPYYQDDLYFKVRYNTADVAKWLESRQKKNKSTRYS